MNRPSERIAENIAALRERISTACLCSGRSADEVRLVAVSKTVGLDEVAFAIAAGISDFAENRSKLFLEKYAAFPKLNWHFIGHIQTNKIKDFTAKACLVHSLASARALAGIDSAAAKLECTQACLLEVNTSGESSKDGVQPADLPALLEAALAMEHIRVDGLMTMASQGDQGKARRSFALLANLRAEMQERYASEKRFQLHELSMGMSEDFITAIEEGATIVRIGRAVWI